MENSAKTIIVTGATGKQGSATVAALLSMQSSSPINILALTRDTSSHSAQQLAANRPNVQLLQGSLSNPEDIFKSANCPVWGVFGMQVNSPTEEAQGKALVNAAITHGVQHFVYSSGDRGGPIKSDASTTNVKNFAAKFAIEKYLIAHAAASPQKMTYTILRPVTFFENQTADIQGKGFARMWQQMGDKKLQMISTKDIGWFAANAFLRPEAHENIALTLVGDELSQPEADVIFKELIGTDMSMAPCLIGSAIKWTMKGTVGDMFKWFAEEGYGGNIEECRRACPGMQDYRAWLMESSQFSGLAQERKVEGKEHGLKE